MTSTTAANRADAESDDEIDTSAFYVTPDEGRRMFDEAARRPVGMSGKEFLRRLDAGEFNEVYDKPGHRAVGYLASLRAFAEQAP